MPFPPWTARRIPVVAVLCALVFILYGASPSPGISVSCQAPQAEDLAPHCQVQRSRRLGWLPKQTADFTWVDFSLTSSLCDNDPRGGGRFCHRLTLIGTDQEVTLPDLRTPLPAAGVTQQLTRFMAGQEHSDLTWSQSQTGRDHLTTFGLALLLSLTAWGFGFWRWPASSALPMDGIEDLSLAKKSKKG